MERGIAVLAAGLFLAAAVAVATDERGESSDHNESYLGYGIAPDAVKKEPFRDRGDRAETIEYVDRASRRVVARERVLPQSGRTIERVLFDDKGQRHGIQRVWYDDGTLKEESSYRNGIMHGLFRVWDEKGRLVGCYRMTNGTGVETVYYSNGRLQREVHYQDNTENGRRSEFYENGQLRYTCNMADGKFSAGIHFRFFQTGRVSAVHWRDNAGQVVGPVVRYGPNGELEGDIEYSLPYQDVTKEVYEKAAATDPRLPRVQKDPQAYKLLDQETAKIIAEFKKMPSVKIPLELPRE